MAHRHRHGRQVGKTALIEIPGEKRIQHPIHSISSPLSPLFNVGSYELTNLNDVLTQSVQIYDLLILGFFHMEKHFTWQLTPTQLCIEHHNRRVSISIEQITNAGVALLSQTPVPENIPTQLLPGMNLLFRGHQTLIQENNQLILARGHSPWAARYIFIPMADPSAQALIDALKERLENRWVGESDTRTIMKKLGIRYPKWFYLALIPVGYFAFVGFILAMAAFKSLLTFNFSETPVVAWFCLLGWVGLIAIIYWINRSRNGR